MKRCLLSNYLIALMAILVSTAFFPQRAMAQKSSAAVLTGTVYEAGSDVTLPGVSCTINGTAAGTVTDMDGNFRLEMPRKKNLEGNSVVISFSCIGFETQEVQWNGQKEMKIYLAESSEFLDDVVVVGYGTQKKSDITGSVGSVSRDRINNTVATDISNIIQGAVPGLNVMATTAGADPSGQTELMLVRGRNSISASNSPLIILDGAPYYGNISDINSADLESIEILKDASSAAIYGSRASNGVILITTRQGSVGKATVSYDGLYGIVTLANFPHIMDGYEYYEYKKGWNDEDDNPDSVLSESEAEVFRDGSWKDWTWQGLLTRKGFSTRHNLSVTGGTKAVKYNVSANYLNNKGTIINDQFQKAQAKTNLTATITDWLSFTTNTMLTWSDGSGDTPNFTDVFNKSPLMRPFNADGSINIVPDYSNEKRFNPIECLLYDDKDFSYKVFTANSLNAKLAKGLTYRLSTSLQYFYSEHDSYKGLNTGAMKSYNGYASISEKTKSSYSIENILNWKRDFGKHGIFLTAVYSFEGYKSLVNNIEGYDFTNDLLSYNAIGQAKTITPFRSEASTSLISQMFRANYDYDGRYLFTATVRRDGFSGFGANNKWGIFPSVAAGWNVANEPFFSKAKNVMNVFKIRLSWGRNGNQAISAYQTLSTLGQGDYLNGSSLAVGYVPETLGSNDLSWESTESYNAGVDFAFFKSRITGEIDAYRNNTTDLLLKRRISSVNGLTSIYQNIGQTRNEGIEFSLTSVNVNTSKFTWKTTLNTALIRTRIVDIYGDGKDDIDNKWFIGYPIKVNYDYYITGVWQKNEANLAAKYGAQPGYAKYDDLNGNGEYDADDRQVIGSPEPNFTWSMNNQFTYGPFDLSIFLYGATGMVKYNPFYAKNILVPHNYWTPDNPTNDYWSKEDGNANQYIASKSVTPGKYEKADFWRIKDITLSYKLPSRITSKAGISNSKIYFSARNPWTFTQYTGMDPELDEQRAKPVQREFLFGVNLSF